MCKKTKEDKSQPAKDGLTIWLTSYANAVDKLAHQTTIVLSKLASAKTVTTNDKTTASHPATEKPSKTD